MVPDRDCPSSLYGCGGDHTPCVKAWGYYALPVLHRDRLVGKVDATADRKAGVLRVDAIHEDEPFSKTAAEGVRRELKDLARWLKLDLVLPA